MNNPYVVRAVGSVMALTVAIPPVEASTQQSDGLSVTPQVQQIIATSGEDGRSVGRQRILGVVSDLIGEAVPVLDAKFQQVYEVPYSTVQPVQGTHLNPTAKKILIGVAILAGVILVILSLTGTLIPI